MAYMPIEVVTIGDIPTRDISRALSVANAGQDSFVFAKLSDVEAGPFRLHAYQNALASHILDILERARSDIRGYHPFLIAVTDAHLDGDQYGNLFGSHRAEKGLAVVTTANVPGIIVPADRLHSYFLYYFARYVLSFIVPQHRNHDDSRACIFDRKVNKLDLLKSMRARALCDICRLDLLSYPSSMSHAQFDAIERIFSLASDAFQAVAQARKPKIFIPSGPNWTAWRSFLP